MILITILGHFSFIRESFIPDGAWAVDGPAKRETSGRGLGSLWLTVSGNTKLVIFISSLLSPVFFNE